MMNLFRDFVKDEQSQDILEHALVVAVVVLLGFVLFHGAGSGMRPIWASSGASLGAANTAAG